MLSYDAPVSVNGHTPSAMADMRDKLNSLNGDPESMPSTLTPVVPTKGTTNRQPAPHCIWLVTGPAGCGKSTVAEFLHSKLDVPYIEGDNYHPQANIDKMAKGTPLTDADRWDWLISLREEALERLSKGATGVVVTCSALKRKYRDVIRVAQYYSPKVTLHFIYLHAPQSVLKSRVDQRQGHYMGGNMVESQFSILEPPLPSEMDVISIDVSKTMAEVQQEALEKVKQAMDEVA